MDALPGVGHACGHNIIATAGVGAGVALAGLADDLGIRVTVLGTPAEEAYGGKVDLASPSRTYGRNSLPEDVVARGHELRGNSQGTRRVSKFHRRSRWGGGRLATTLIINPAPASTRPETLNRYDHSRSPGLIPDKNRPDLQTTI